jgi:hypothetical protein
MKSAFVHRCGILLFERKNIEYCCTHFFKDEMSGRGALPDKQAKYFQRVSFDQKNRSGVKSERSDFNVETFCVAAVTTSTVRGGWVKARYDRRTRLLVSRQFFLPLGCPDQGCNSMF